MHLILHMCLCVTVCLSSPKTGLKYLFAVFCLPLCSLQNDDYLPLCLQIHEDGFPVQYSLLQNHAPTNLASVENMLMQWLQQSKNLKLFILKYVLVNDG